MLKYLQYLALAAVLLFTVPKMWSNYQDRKSSKSWPVVTGRLLSSEVREVTDRSTDSNGHTIRTRHFELIVRYAYAVDGRAYVGNRVRATTTQYSSKASATESLARFHNTEPVKVFYDPGKPASSVLEQG